MKFAVLATIFTVLVMVEARKECSSEEDCENDECCVAESFSLFRNGFCKPKEGEGDRCNSEASNGKYHFRCPCGSGLICEPEFEKDFGFGKLKINERCISEDTSKEPEPETEIPVVETEAPAEE